MRSPEGREKDDIKKYLKHIGAWYFCPFMMGMGKAGVADIVACIRHPLAQAYEQHSRALSRGTFWSIEVKRENALPTKRQLVRMNEVRAAGGMATWGTAQKVIAEIELWRQSKG